MPVKKIVEVISEKRCVSVLFIVGQFWRLWGGVALVAQHAPYTVTLAMIENGQNSL